MCPYMINFIHKLKDLPEKYMMNSVLENFTILQVISHRHTNETLLCIAFVFEISDNDVGPSHNIYRLVKPSESSSNSSSSPTTTSSSSTSSSSSSSSATSASSASTVRGNIRVWERTVKHERQNVQKTQKSYRRERTTLKGHIEIEAIIHRIDSHTHVYVHFTHETDIHTFYYDLATLSHVRGGPRCHCPTESILYIQKDRLVQDFSPLPLVLCVHLHTHTVTPGREEHLFFSNGLFRSQMFTGEENDGARQKWFEGFAFLAYVESLSRSPSNRSFLCPPHPVSSLPIPELLHIRGTFSGWMGGYLFLPLSHSLTSSICCTCRPSSFLSFSFLSLPSTCRSTFHSFFVSSLFSLKRESLRKEEE